MVLLSPQNPEVEAWPMTDLKSSRMEIDSVGKFVGAMSDLMALDTLFPNLDHLCKEIKDRRKL